MTQPHFNVYSSTEEIHLDRIWRCILDNKYQTTVELGVYTGGSLFRIVDAVQKVGGGTVTGIDNALNTLEIALEGVKKWQHLFPDVVVSLIHDQLPDAITKHLSAGIDFVFIDDFHEAAHVKKEIQLLLPLMKPRSSIMGHDTGDIPGLAGVFTEYGGVLYNEGHGLGEISLGKGKP